MQVKWIELDNRTDNRGSLIVAETKYDVTKVNKVIINSIT